MLKQIYGLYSKLSWRLENEDITMRRLFVTYFPSFSQNSEVLLRSHSNLSWSFATHNARSLKLE